MTQYFLQPHVFLGVSDDQVIILDLKKDKYLALQAARAESLADAITGWPRVPSRSDAHNGGASPSHQILDLMVRRGLLTTDRTRGKAATPISIDAPRNQLRAESCAAPVYVSHVVNFLAATLKAAAKLRISSIETVVRGVERRNAQHGAQWQPADLIKARVLLGAYETLRPFVFTARDKCLLDALVLVEFLARYGLFPSWVFGVRASPFAAHCWVQKDDVAFNDSIDHIRIYTPIMAV